MGGWVVFVCRLVDWLVGLFVLVGWLVGWLVGGWVVRLLCWWVGG